TSGYTTPVGTLRPNGGAPTTPGSTSTDALAAIPVSLTPPDPPPPAGGGSGGGSSSPGGGSSSPGGGSSNPGGGSSSPGTPDPPGISDAFGQAVDATSRVANTETSGENGERRADDDRTGANGDSASDALPTVVGGPGVGQIADLGRNAGVSG